MTGSNKLTKRDYLKTSLRAFFCQNGFNYSNYQGLGYANVMYPALKNTMERIRKVSTKPWKKTVNSIIPTHTSCLLLPACIL